MSKPLEEWSHRDFAEDLAEAKNMTLVEVPLGSMVMNRNQTIRADVVEVKPSYTNFYITIYEVKQRRSDILSSLRNEKWKNYLPHCHRFHFATRRGIISQDELPDGVGLTLRNENGWYTVQAGDIDKEREVPRETLKALMFQRVKFANNVDRREKIASHYQIRRELKQVGEEVAQAIDFHQQFGWAINKALENGFGRYELTEFIRDMAQVDDRVTEALEFQRKYQVQIERLEEVTNSQWGAKGMIRKIIRDLQSDD